MTSPAHSTPLPPDDLLPSGLRCGRFLFPTLPEQKKPVGLFIFNDEGMSMENPKREMPRYKCHKEVWALKIAAIAHKKNPDVTGQSASASYGAVIEPTEFGYAPFEVSAEYVIKHRPEAGGYYVVYADGYKSYSPAAAFESGYTAI